MKSHTGTNFPEGEQLRDETRSQGGAKFRKETQSPEGELSSEEEFSQKGLKSPKGAQSQESTKSPEGDQHLDREKTLARAKPSEEGKTEPSKEGEPVDGRQSGRNVSEEKIAASNPAGGGAHVVRSTVYDPEAKAESKPARKEASGEAAAKEARRTAYESLNLDDQTHQAYLTKRSESLQKHQEQQRR